MNSLRHYSLPSFFPLWWNTASPFMEHKLKKNKKDVFIPLWKIEAFNPRDRQTTEAVTCLEISEKTLKRYWRCELNLFYPIFLPLALLYQWGCSPSSLRGAAHPGPCAGTATALHSPLALVAQLRVPSSIPGTYFSGFCLFFFFPRDLPKFPLPSDLHTPPLERVKQEQGRKSHNLSEARKDDLCYHLWGMTVTVDLLSGLDYIW